MAEGTDPLFVNVRTGESIPFSEFFPDGSVTTDKIEDGAVTTAKIDDEAVTTAKLAFNAVFFSRMQDISSDRLLGRDTASSGDIEEISLSTGLEFSGSQSIRLANTAVTPGSYTNADITVDQQGRLTAAASGSAGPIIDIIQQGSLSSQATLDIPVDGDTWDEVEVVLLDITPATDNVSLFFRVSQSGSFLSGASDYAWGIHRIGSDGSTQTAVTDNDNADSEITLTGVVLAGNAAGDALAFKLKIFKPTASSTLKVAMWEGFLFNANSHRHITGSGQLLLNQNAIEDIQFLFSSGNIASGVYYAVGKKYT